MSIQPDHDHHHDVPLYEQRELPARPARHTEPLWGGARLAARNDLSVRRGNPAIGDERLRLHATPLVESSADGAKLVALPFEGIELSGEDLDRHMLCIGQTGDGKTLRFIAQMVLAILAFTQRTMVIVNSKGPWFTRVVTALVHRFRPSAELIVLNMADPKRSRAWNPFAGQMNDTRARIAWHRRCVTRLNCRPRGTIRRFFDNRRSSFWRACC